MSTCHQLKSSVFFNLAIAITLFSLSSCGNRSSMETNQAAMVIASPVTDIAKTNDKRFLEQVVEINYEQILIGRLAQQRSADEEVKALAKMLEEANRNNKSALAALSLTKSIPFPRVPTTSAQDAYNKLNESSTEDFDMMYIHRVLQHYSDFISLFENTTQSQHDPDIQAWATQMLPELRNHWEQAKQCEAHLNPVSELIR